VAEIIQVQGCTKTFRANGVETQALRGVDLAVRDGELMMLVGPSGCGKTTLISILAGILAHDGGSVRVLGEDLGAMPAAQLPAFRRRNLGFVFQAFNLIPALDVLDNISIPLILNGMKRTEALERADDLATRVGLRDRRHHRPTQLSGGQQQRVAIARTLLQRARAILADEPIASLDPESARSVMQNLRDINRRDGTTVVVSLHQVEHARAWCRRAVAMRDGRVVFDGPARDLTDAKLGEIYGCCAEALRPSAEPEPDESPAPVHLGIPALA
jgi:ABC-type lipoprotein export system ATPase subunit